MAFSGGSANGVSSRSSSSSRSSGSGSGCGSISVWDKCTTVMLLPRARLITLWLAFNLALIVQEPMKKIASVDAATGGGSMLGDVNISAILDSFSVSYDKRVRPNYGGPPVEVGVTMYVLSISSLSEVKMVHNKPKSTFV
ncbi:PREDICTED: gamma-aminobutyric acid receptor subunit beta-like [Rhagoletis zephyria]|uniref:gamma-aminobutyric acid receptor subunit beta-like n=1 Tax=Rhagoletis zephyria TaxID=28612 RepID=UPI0008114BD9|nr:PREDICTED: gamma-aminobutyric acid receptor subunit beta-like [Rhagoletis zephyria]